MSCQYIILCSVYIIKMLYVNKTLLLSFFTAEAFLRIILFIFNPSSARKKQQTTKFTAAKVIKMFRAG